MKKENFLEPNFSMQIYSYDKKSLRILMLLAFMIWEAHGEQITTERILTLILKRALDLV
jgi:hypothetical protein